MRTQLDPNSTPDTTASVGVRLRPPELKEAHRNMRIRARQHTGRYLSPIVAVAVALLSFACTRSPYVPPEGVPELFAVVEADPSLHESAMEGCVQVHNLWKAQVRAIHLTAGGSIAERAKMLRDSVYTPHSEFWDGYVGNFKRWVRREFDLAGHSHRAFPTQIDLPRLITEATTRAAAMTGIRGCAEWFLVYGPGWAGMGGLSDGRMLVDFFGDHSSAENMHWAVPHEVAHVLRHQESEPETRNVLAVTVDEGAAVYFEDIYWGDDKNAAEALGYSNSDWDWAIAHEAELWGMAIEQLEDSSRAVMDLYQRADLRLHPDGPTGVGYFLGYRISESYVDRHGRMPWRICSD